MSEDKRISFSYPESMKKDLEKLAKEYKIKLMGYIKMVLYKETDRIKRRSS